MSTPRQVQLTSIPTMIPALTRALFDSDLIISRLLLSLSELLWTIMLLWPGDTFSRPTYMVMSHVMKEEAWAVVFLFSAITQFMIVVHEHFHRTFARYFAAWNAGLWAFVVVSMFLSVYPPPAAIAGETSLALVASWIWLRPYILAEGLRRVKP